MQTDLLKGTGVAIVTPFTKKGDIDEKALRKLVQHLIKGKVEYIVVFGTTGESVTLSKDEKKKDAAIRELAEETSIVITKEQISNPDEPIIVNYINKEGINYKRLYLYTVYIEDISEVGLETEIVPIENLQIEELDWCGFLTKEEAQDKIFSRVEHLLDLIN